jgi:hypothetical protein
VNSNDMGPATLTIGRGREVAPVDPEVAANDAAFFREVLYFAVSIPLVVPAIVLVGAVLRFFDLY